MTAFFWSIVTRGWLRPVAWSLSSGYFRGARCLTLPRSSGGLGSALTVGRCDSSYSGSWGYEIGPRAPARIGGKPRRAATCLDRPLRARTHPGSMPAAVAARLLQLRRPQRLGRDKAAHPVGLSPSTASRIIARAALPALHELDPVTGIRIRASRRTQLRYEHQQTNTPLHIHVKKLHPPPPDPQRPPTPRAPAHHRGKEPPPHPRQGPLASRRAGHNRPQPRPDPVSQAWHELHPRHRRGPLPARIRPRPAGREGPHLRHRPRPHRPDLRQPPH